MERPQNAAVSQPSSQPKFKVIKALGRGSYGTVYKVQRQADGQVYAMKETDIGRMGQQERMDAVNEIRLLGSLQNPNVVRHHETFLAGNKLCIVMEFAPAGDLQGFLKAAASTKIPLPEATIWQIFLQLCQGMQAIHETCVIHRDIKPANIFMCPDNVVKIGDLGVAKALTKAHYAQTQIGTPVFMAPEVWKGLPYGYNSDLWSLGCVLYEMMTYKLPFDARSINELKNKVIMGAFQALAPGTYSSGLVSLCHALLSRDPRKRPTCAAMLNSPEAAAWMHAIPAAVRQPLPPLHAPGGIAVAKQGAAAQLLPTIRVPRDIRLLPGQLPKPSYGSGQFELAVAAAAAGRQAQAAALLPVMQAQRQRSGSGSGAPPPKPQPPAPSILDQRGAQVAVAGGAHMAVAPERRRSAGKGRMPSASRVVFPAAAQALVAATPSLRPPSQAGGRPPVAANSKPPSRSGGGQVVAGSHRQAVAAAGRRVDPTAAAAAVRAAGYRVGGMGEIDNKVGGMATINVPAYKRAVRAY
eukprot:jgi/Chrzof1/9187/Cz03g39050.t1